MPLVRLADYRPAPYLLERTDLTVQLHSGHTEVLAQLAFLPNPLAQPGPLVLQGVDLELLELQLDGELLPAEAFQLSADQLLIAQPPAGAFQLQSRVRIHPETNSTLEGLYASGGLFTTQCEAEGFRRITFHPTAPICSVASRCGSKPIAPAVRCCSPTATALRAALCPPIPSVELSATSPFGTTPSPNPPISLPWWRASLRR
jgi:hypothetical protein